MVVCGDPVFDVVLHLIEAFAQGRLALSVLDLQRGHLLGQARYLAVLLLLADVE